MAIARAVIKEPPILLLDEPTGSMDSSSEEQVKRELEQFTQGKTLVLVTHRTSLLDLVERIIVLDGGKLVADGPKNQVIETLRQGRIIQAVDGGVVSDILVKEGQDVAAGQLLLRIDPPRFVSSFRREPLAIPGPFSQGRTAESDFGKTSVCRFRRSDS